jgi:glycosyltransferase involved in cell wall biosynthesis
MHLEVAEGEAQCLDPRYSTTRIVNPIPPVCPSSPDDAFQSALFAPVGEGRKGEGGLRKRHCFKRSLPGKPLVTLITVVYNGHVHLERAIRSVLEQTYDNIEYLIIDGGSDDGTLGIIRSFDHAIDYWLSERDDGIYDAMNKGIRLASGEVVGLVNSDDFLYENAILSVVRALSGHDPLPYVCAPIELMNECGQVFGIKRPAGNLEMDNMKYREMPYPHPGLFMPLQLYKAVGLYNTAYPLRADYEHSIRLINSKSMGVVLTEPTGVFSRGGASDSFGESDETRRRLITETKEILRHFGVSTVKRRWVEFRFLFKSALVRLLPGSAVRWLKRYTRSTWKHY